MYINIPKYTESGTPGLDYHLSVYVYTEQYSAGPIDVKTQRASFCHTMYNGHCYINLHFMTSMSTLHHSTIAGPWMTCQKLLGEPIINVAKSVYV